MMTRLQTLFTNANVSMDSLSPEEVTRLEDALDDVLATSREDGYEAGYDVGYDLGLMTGSSSY